MRNIFKLATAAAALTGLAGCSTGFPTQVKRFEAMPAPTGESFVVVPMNPADEGGLEFSRYAAMVADEMTEEGYRPAAAGEEPTMIVRLGYDVDEGRERAVRSMPGYGYDYGPYGYSPYDVRLRSRLYDPFYDWRYRRLNPYYARHPYYGSRLGFYFGWDDPFWYSPYGSRYGAYGASRLRSYTEYQSELDLDIRRAGTDEAIFEGTARARSRTDDLGTLVPNLITAMFTDFPGNSGETVRITVKPDDND